MRLATHLTNGGAGRNAIRAAKVMSRLGEQLPEQRLEIRAMERRWHKRHKVNVAAGISFNSSPIPQPCRIRNYSMGGLFVETQAPLYRHQFVMLWIPELDGGVKLVRGMVIHLTGDGAGIEAEEHFWARGCDFQCKAKRPKPS